MTLNKSDEGTFVANRLIIQIEEVKRKSNIGYTDPVMYIKTSVVDPMNQEVSKDDSWLIPESEFMNIEDPP